MVMTITIESPTDQPEEVQAVVAEALKERDQAPDDASPDKEPTPEDKLAPGSADAVHQLVQRRLVVHYEGRFMSLVTEPGLGERLAAERRQIVAGKGTGQTRRPNAA